MLPVKVVPVSSSHHTFRVRHFRRMSTHGDDDKMRIDRILLRTRIRSIWCLPALATARIRKEVHLEHARCAMIHITTGVPRAPVTAVTSTVLKDDCSEPRADALPTRSRLRYKEMDRVQRHVLFNFRNLFVCGMISDFNLFTQNSTSTMSSREYQECS